MPAHRSELRNPVPRCSVRNHPGVTRQQCADCTAWGQHLAALRRDAIAAGQVHKREVGPRPWRLRPELLEPKPKCRIHKGKHGKDWNCKVCRDRDTYVAAVARDERRRGIDNRRRPVAEVRAHIISLIQHGGHCNRSIADRAGCSQETVARIRLAGQGDRKTRTVDYLTWKSIMDVEPVRAGHHIPEGFVDPLESVRIIRGLAAQGWSYEHIAHVAGYQTKGGISTLGRGVNRYIKPELAERIRLVADKLGDQDITETPRPYPVGMNLRSHREAMRRGWVPLRDWDGLDMADPNTRPFTAAPEVDQEITAGAGRVLVDYDAILRTVRAARGDDEYVGPALSMNKMEAYILVRLAQTHGLSATETGALLGYPQQEKANRSVGQRQATRMRSQLAAAQKWIDSEPDGKVPRWFSEEASNKPNYAHLLPALIATQPDPIGRGMSVADLAQRIGVDTAEVEAFLSHAARSAAKPWIVLLRKVNAQRRTTRRGSAGRGRAVSRCPDVQVADSVCVD